MVTVVPLFGRHGRQHRLQSTGGLKTQTVSVYRPARLPTLATFCAQFLFRKLQSASLPHTELAGRLGYAQASMQGRTPEDDISHGLGMRMGTCTPDNWTQVRFPAKVFGAKEKKKKSTTRVCVVAFGPRCCFPSQMDLLGDIVM